MHYYHLQLYLLLTNHSDHLVLYTDIYLYEYHVIYHRKSIGVSNIYNILL